MVQQTIIIIINIKTLSIYRIDLKIIFYNIPEIQVLKIALNADPAKNKVSKYQFTLSPCGLDTSLSNSSVGSSIAPMRCTNLSFLA